MSETDAGQAIVPADYDSDPARFAANQAATTRFSLSGDLHVPVADRLCLLTPAPVLDLGGGNGTLAGLLVDRDVQTVVLDLAAHVDQAPGLVVRGDAQRLPFLDCTFGAVAALWMMYHLQNPKGALLEAARELSPGGTFVASTPSRFNDPEIARALPDWGRAFSFDAESASSLISDVFEVVEVERWDSRAIALPDREAVELFLRGRGLPQSRAREFAGEFATPLAISKRGALIWATRR